MIVELDVFCNKVIAEFKTLQAKRSYKERTIFDKKGKRMRRKLEEGYHKGLKDAIRILEHRYKKFTKELEKEAENEQG